MYDDVVGVGGGGVNALYNSYIIETLIYLYVYTGIRYLPFNPSNPPKLNNNNNDFITLYYIVICEMCAHDFNTT